MLFGLMALFYIRTTLQYSLHYGLPSRNYGLPAKYYVVAVEFLRLLYFKDLWKPVQCYMWAILAILASFCPHFC